jgi:glyoxylase-like metal-dependent hydrolase (beta-lactamase superfamily II)
MTFAHASGPPGAAIPDSSSGGAAIRSVTDKPVTHAVNTRFHGDHTSGIRTSPTTRWDHPAAHSVPRLGGSPGSAQRMKDLIDLTNGPGETFARSRARTTKTVTAIGFTRCPSGQHDLSR